MSHPNIIYDVGANNGDDTAFYLAKGFDVVAIEANPDLCKALQERFSGELATKRLVLENVGVAGSHGELTFYSNSYSDWSSFLKNSKATQTNSYEEIAIKTEPLSDIIARNGEPYYIKLDIEGFELQGIRTLRNATGQAPYLSFEINADWAEILNILSEVGYRKFQVVRQGPDYLPACPNPPREGNHVEVHFNNHMSGPFGRDLPDAWIDVESINQHVKDVLEQRKQNAAAGQKPGWHDIHCALA